MVVLVVVLLASAVTPPAAQALHIGPVDVNPVGLFLACRACGLPGDPLSGLLGGGIAKLAVGAFDAIIKALFAPIAKFITDELIGWLVAVPNFTAGQRRAAGADGGRDGRRAAGCGRDDLDRSATGGRVRGRRRLRVRALEGLARTVGAALLLAIWPWLFDTAVS